jgi:hypothetical protein
MRRKISLSAALGLVLLSNAWVLFGVWQNRREVLGTVELTERELCFSRPSADNTGVFLKLIWDSQALRWRHDRQDGPGWFDRAKLAALGFDVDWPVDSKDAVAHYFAVPDKRVFVALEYDGPSSGTIPGETNPERTRLVAVDAARDYQTLRRRYPDFSHHLILPGIVSLVLEQPRARETEQPAGQPYLRGGIWGLEPAEIQVPLPHSRVLTSLGGLPCAGPGGRSSGSRPPRYRVKLAIGREHIPWVVDVLPLQ